MDLEERKSKKSSLWSELNSNFLNKTNVLVSF